MYSAYMEKTRGRWEPDSRPETFQQLWILSGRCEILPGRCEMILAAARCSLAAVRYSLAGYQAQFETPWKKRILLFVFRMRNCGILHIDRYLQYIL